MRQPKIPSAGTPRNGTTAASLDAGTVIGRRGRHPGFKARREDGRQPSSSRPPWPRLAARQRRRSTSTHITDAGGSTRVRRRGTSPVQLGRERLIGSASTRTRTRPGVWSSFRNGRRPTFTGDAVPAHEQRRVTMSMPHGSMRQERGRARARTAQAGRAAPCRLSDARQAHRLAVACGSALIVLALTAPAAGSPGGQETRLPTREPRLPTQLLKTFPLDPVSGRAGDPSFGTRGARTIRSRPRAATTTAPRGETPSADAGASGIVPLAAAMGGLASLLAVGGAVLIARRRSGLLLRRHRLRPAPIFRTSPEAASSDTGPVDGPPRRIGGGADRVRPPRARMHGLLSETGSLIPLERIAWERRTEPTGSKTVSRGETSPRQKLRPGLAPPATKERQVRSGLPPWKSAPRPADRPPDKPSAAIPSTPDSSPIPPPSDPAPLAAAPQPLNSPQRAEPRRRAGRTGGTRVRAGECEIEWRRGHLRSDFYAFALRPGGTTTVVARSPSFPWQSDDPPPSEGPAAAAHAALVARLGAEGWELVSSGNPWYRIRLRRRLKPTLRDFADSGGLGSR